MADSPTRLPIRSASPEEPRTKSKRRSLLLQPGTLVAAQRQTYGNGVNSNLRAPQRPTTMFNPDASTLADLATKFGDESKLENLEEESGVTSNSDALARLEGRSMRSPTKTPAVAAPSASRTGLARSQSLRKPTSVSESTRPPSTATRSSTLRPSRPLSTLVESTTTRPLRPDSSISNSSSEHQIPSSRLKAPSSTTASSAGLRRPAPSLSRNGQPLNARPQSVLITPTQLSGPSQPILEEASAAPRPGFSTYQQHYTPQKRAGPKPASATLMHAPSARDAASAAATPLDTQLAQLQLLQLSVLHGSAGSAGASWDASARAGMQRRFGGVADAARTVAALERERARRRNVRALREWGAGPAAAGPAADAAFAENVQGLARAVGDAWALGERGGRVAQVLEMFRWWVGGVEAVWEGRAAPAAGRARAGEFVEDLGEDWRGEVSALIRRLGALERGLQSLPAAADGSSLAALITAFGELIKGMTEELKTVQSVEKKIMEGEAGWIDNALSQLDFSVSQDGGWS